MVMECISGQMEQYMKVILLMISKKVMESTLGVMVTSMLDNLRMTICMVLELLLTLVGSLENADIKMTSS